MRSREASTTARTPAGSADDSITPLWVEEEYVESAERGDAARAAAALDEDSRSDARRKNKVEEWISVVGDEHTLLGSDAAGAAVSLFVLTEEGSSCSGSAESSPRSRAGVSPPRRHVKASAVVFPDYFGTSTDAYVRLKTRVNLQQRRCSLEEYSEIVKRSQRGEAQHRRAPFTPSLADRWAHSDSDSDPLGLSVSGEMATLPPPPTLHLPARLARGGTPSHESESADVSAKSSRARPKLELRSPRSTYATDDPKTKDCVSTASRSALLHVRWSPALDIGRHRRGLTARNSLSRPTSPAPRPWCFYTFKASGSSRPTRRPGALVFRSAGFTLCEIAADVATNAKGQRACIGARRVMTLLRSLIRNARVESRTRQLAAKAPRFGALPRGRQRASSAASAKAEQSLLTHAAVLAAEEAACAPPSPSPSRSNSLAAARFGGVAGNGDYDRTTVPSSSRGTGRGGGGTGKTPGRGRSGKPKSALERGREDASAQEARALRERIHKQQQQQEAAVDALGFISGDRGAPGNVAGGARPGGSGPGSSSMGSSASVHTARRGQQHGQGGKRPQLHARVISALHRVANVDTFYGVGSTPPVVDTDLLDRAVGPRAVLWLRASGAAALAAAAGDGYYAALSVRANGVGGLSSRNARALSLDVVSSTSDSGSGKRPLSLDVSGRGGGAASAAKQETKTGKVIARDVPRTLPLLLSDAQREALERLLRCYALRSQKTVGYAQGMNVLAAIALLSGAGEEGSFWLLAALVERLCVAQDGASYFGHDLAGLHSDITAVQAVLAESFPHIADGLKRAEVYSEWFLSSMLLSCFANNMHIGVTRRLWDVMFLLSDDAPRVLFATACAFFELNAPRLCAALGIALPSYITVRAPASSPALASVPASAAPSASTSLPSRSAAGKSWSPLRSERRGNDEGNERNAPERRQLQKHNSFPPRAALGGGEGGAGVGGSGGGMRRSASRNKLNTPLASGHTPGSHAAAMAELTACISAWQQRGLDVAAGGCGVDGDALIDCTLRWCYRVDRNRITRAREHANVTDTSSGDGVAVKNAAGGGGEGESGGARGGGGAAEGGAAASWWQRMRRGGGGGGGEARKQRVRRSIDGIDPLSVAIIASRKS